ncbi:alpha/beta hydrolase [Legionella micdadei]|uniref:Alpha/beta hydrolase family protein n=1 Tax=Legionella micdadei TaxID=451 RepID=A0A098GLD0_LEGMI|nr:alpha/beta hydrolase [Legionella micdadei]ARG98711.1 alpha/beta hydrolase [Legionella micdadei]ARH01429.1 alpha/beta hydrolase [Legionella micdadei]KTD28925.1 substrate of the Dot/Icm system [Legionella micdadei]CEG62306.1 protein of unknown function [Legionella micdadei]SCY04161.1 Alpha/beta hydrolase family protein [Legionella micdadei]
MKEFPVAAQPFRKELENYLKFVGRDRLEIHYCDQRPCFFVEADPETDTSIEVGYFLWNNQLYYRSNLNSLSNPVHLTDEQITLLKNRIAYPDTPSPLLITTSQLQHFLALTGPRKAIFLTIDVVDNQLRWRFGDNTEMVIADDEEKIHPALSALYDSLKQFNKEQQTKEQESEPTFPQTQPQSDYYFEMPAKTTKETFLLPFIWLSKGLKTLLRILLFDNFLFKYTIGLAVAFVANYGNPYYKAEPGTLSDILRQIIFPGGTKKPQVHADGSITLDPTLSRQFYALKMMESHRNLATNEIEYTVGTELVKFSEFYIQMPDGSQVAGIQASNRLVEAHSSDGQIPYVIFCNGNSGCYQEEAPYDAYFLEKCAQKGIPVNMVRFNYPGVLNSTGYPSVFDDLVLAGIAQKQRLLTKGVRSENIQVHGFSLGGAIASYVASFFHERDQTPGACYVSRTFSSTTNVGLSYVRKIPVIGPLLGYVLRPILAFGLWGTEWLADTAKHLASLPDDRTWYTVARTPKTVQTRYSEQNKPIKDDEVLVYDASIHQSWRFKLKRFLAKHFGLFGYKKETYKEMNAARKLVTCFREKDTFGEEVAKLSSVHCAHADVRPFGLRLDETGNIRQLADSNNYPQLALFARSQTSSGAIMTEIPETTIAKNEELGNQSVEFLRMHSPCVNSTHSASRYFDFFKQDSERSEREKIASKITQTIIDYIP